ncbi:AAA family ATPase [Chloroflexia bacterium SDU3-3]|nr:AAA family ATPase [Chloroflexia bacterium SDU3-3]
MLSILLLGPPQIVLDRQPIDIPRRKTRALLYYLAARQTAVTRERLLHLFWPDHERSAAQQTLRTTLHGIRKSLGDVLSVTNEHVGLADDAQVDLQLFEAQLASGAAEQIALGLALYRGLFLEDFSLPDNEDFERWAENERERTRQLALGGFLRLAQQHEDSQNFPAALGALTQALALDPLHEEIQRATMRTQYRAGDRAGAIRRYEQLRDRLDEELGVPPMAETQALYDAIITDALAPPADHAPLAPIVPAPPPRDELPFISRAPELERLIAAAESHRLLVLEGEPGIGKTRLATTWLNSQDRVVLRGSAYELEQAIPYHPISEALRGLCGMEWRDRAPIAPIWQAELARLVPELAGGAVPPAPPGDESRLWEAVRQLLHALARVKPVALFLDDLHWADTATLGLLGYLVRQSSAARISYLVTMRGGQQQPALATLLQALTRAGQIERIVVPRLTSEEMARIARALSAADSEALAKWLDAQGEGNPYVITELVRSIRERGWLRANGTIDRAALDSAPLVPHTLYSLIQSRLAQLSPSALHLLHLAVAIGREFEFPLLASAAHMPSAALLDAFDELRRAALILPIGGQRFRFDHSLTMEVAYREVGEPRHRQMHRTVAEALEQASPPLDDALIASHFAEGDQPERAAPYALRAAQHAMSLSAWQEAATFFELACYGQQPPELTRILTQLGVAYTNAGDAQHANERLRKAIVLAEQHHDAAEARAARLALARTLLTQGRYREVIDSIQPLLGTPDAASAEFFWGAALSLEGADLCSASAHLRKAEQLLESGAGAIHRSQVQFELGSILAQQGDLPGAIRTYQGVIETASGAIQPDEITWYILAHNNLAYHLHLLGDPAARGYAERGIVLARESGYLQLTVYLRSTLGEIQLAAGELDDAEQSFRKGLVLSEQFHIPERTAGLTANLGLLALRRGQQQQAAALLAEALAQSDSLGTHHLSAQIRIWLAPLLPRARAAALLAEARALAESGQRNGLLAQIAQIEQATEAQIA